MTTLFRAWVVLASAAVVFAAGARGVSAQPATPVAAVEALYADAAAKEAAVRKAMAAPDIQPTVLKAVRAMIRPSGRLIVVEYGADRGNPWVPHPFSFGTWQRLSEEAGFVGTALLGAVPRRYLGSIYSAVSLKA